MKFNRQTRENITREASRLLDRLKHTAPFPVRIGGPHTTYLHLMPPEVYQAIKLLMNAEGYGGILDNNNYAPMYILREDDNGNQKKWGMQFRFGNALPSANNWRSKVFIDPDSPYYDKIVAWSYRVDEVNKEIAVANRYINKLARECNTPGQWYRAFPDFIHFLPEEAKNTISKALKQSPLPYGLDEETVRKTTPIVAASVAKALMLPEKAPSVWPE